MDFFDRPVGELLPGSLRTAVFPLKKKHEDYISDPMKEKMPWSVGDHAIYLGKWPRPDSKVDSIYSDEVVLALADYAKAQNEDGVVNVVLGPHFSQWFNGELLGEGTDYLSPEEQKAHIEEILLKQLGLKDRLRVTFWKDDGRHCAFFSKIEAASAHGLVAPERLFLDFERKKLDPNSEDFSYQVAGRLFLVAEANASLRADFLKTVPGRIQQEDVEEGPVSEKTWGTAGYGLCEVALRLSELIQGRPIQLGVDRQGKYDAIIQKLLKQAGLSNPNYPGLEDLYELLKGKSFRSIKLSTKENFFKKRKDQVRARVRTGVQAVGFLALGALGYGVGHYQASEEERRLAERIQERVVDCAKDLEFPLSYDACCRGAKTDDPAASFNRLADDLVEELNDRYKVDPSLLTLRPAVVDYLCARAKDRPYSVTNAHLDPSLLAILADDFVRAQAATFSLAGYNLDRPYQDLWDQRDVLLTASDEQADLPRKPKYLGHFSGITQGRFSYDLWADEEGAGVWDSTYSDPGKFSKKRGEEAVREFFELQRYHDALEVESYLSKNNSGVMWNDFMVQNNYPVTLDCMASGQKYQSGCVADKVYWADSVTDKEYWFTQTYVEIPKTKEWEYVVIAKNSSDSEFSAVRGQEAIKVFQDLRRSVWSASE